MIWFLLEYDKIAQFDLQTQQHYTQKNEKYISHQKKVLWLEWRPQSQIDIFTQNTW